MADREDAPCYEELLDAWKAMHGQRGVTVREVPCENARGALLYVEAGTPGKPLISFTACMHGDEPVTPWALLSIVQNDLLHSGFLYRMWPCVNPDGYSAGVRENGDGDDINRSFHHGGRTPEARTVLAFSRDQRFALQVDLHEDCEAEGFYCYEPNSQPGGFHGPDIVERIRNAGYPLQELTANFDLGYSTETLRLHHGRVVYDPVESAETMSGTPFNVYLFCRRAAQRVTTFETPASLPWKDRVDMHRLAVTGALAHVAGFNGIAA